jgi:hypothetical protein
MKNSINRFVVRVTPFAQFWWILADRVAHMFGGCLGG